MDAAVVEKEDVYDADLQFPERSEDAVKEIELAAKRGRDLIELNGTFQRAGMKENGYPELAIAHHKRDRVFADGWNGELWFTTYEKIELVGRERGFGTRLEKSGPNQVQVKMPGVSLENEIETSVPDIPDKIETNYAIPSDAYILWEVEEWQQTPDPVLDPFLIVHVAGSVWSVLKQWDVTSLEAAALSRFGVPTDG